MTKNPPRRLHLTVLASALLAACAAPTTTSPPPPAAKLATAAAPAGAVPIDPVVDTCNVTKPNTAITPALLTSGLPCEASLVAPFNLENLQHGFDYYSWLTFIALNAPAPGQAPAPGSDAPALWEDWKEVSDFILADGATPDGWDAPRTIPAACRDIAGAEDLRVVNRWALNKTVASETGQPFDTGPLIDQNGNYVRYELLVNRPMFEYLLQNRLYSRSGQQAFAGDIDFPAGAVQTGSTGTVGAIMVKVAWKVMGAGDDASRFHTVDALAYNPPSTNPRVEESCEPVTLGLVGWHAAHKTDAEPQWLWSTFEQVDNVPDADALTAGMVDAHYNFFDPACSDCTVNEPPPRPWNPDVQPFPGGFTSQVTRVVPLTPETVKLNDSFRQILDGTVWQHYELISTQWPADASSPTDPNGVPAPTFLANTTLETYSQGEVPQASSSCMACHGNAVDTTGRPSDFTYILERAQ